MRTQNVGLLALALALIIGSTWIGGRQEEAEFAGTDEQAMEIVAVLQPNYQPWFGVLWEPPPEVASGLFALQAALGAGMGGYYLGFRRGQAAGQRKPSDAGD